MLAAVRPFTAAVSLLAALAFAAPATAMEFTVNTLADGSDQSVLLPACDVGDGHCTLRAAIEQANFLPGPDEITFAEAGTHLLPLGPLTVTSGLTITGMGAGPGGTTIDGGLTHRVIDFTSPTTLTLGRLRVQRGWVGDQDGAGIRAAGGSLVLDRVIVAGNAIGGASGAGAGISSDGGTLQIDASTITDNYVPEGHGAGVALPGTGGSATIRNSTISGNGAGTGGGGLYTSAPVTLLGTTIAGNGSTSGSSQLGVATGTPTLTVENTIVAGPAPACELPDGFGPAAEDSIDSGTTCGFSSASGNRQNTDPLLEDLATGAGGETPTRRPLPGSPAVDGAGADCGLLPADQRGVSRPQGPACDIGAVERRPDVTATDTATVGEDSGSTGVDVLANDSAPDGGLAVKSVNQPAHGAAAVASGGDGVTYTPAPDQCGPDSFTYTTAGGGTGTVVLTVTCADDAPGAVDDSATVDEDAAETPIDVLANDADVDGGPRRVESVTAASHGVVLAIEDGARVAYRPDAGYCGADAFTYVLNGGSSATVAVTVNCVDEPIVAPPPPPPPVVPTGRCAGISATIVLGKGTIAVVGSRQRDVIVGSTGSEKIDGGGGNDVVCAGKGNDTLLGRAGKDRLLGGAGNDLIDGGTGLDTIAAGAGRDRVAGGRDRARDRLDCGAATDRARYARGDRFKRCERVTGKPRKRRREVPHAR